MKKIINYLHRNSIIICYIMGHKWKYNFSSIPDKAICSRCYTKNKLNLHNLSWNEVENFDNEKRTDEKLCHEWG